MSALFREIPSNAGKDHRAPCTILVQSVFSRIDLDPWQSDHFLVCFSVYQNMVSLWDFNLIFQSRIETFLFNSLAKPAVISSIVDIGVRGRDADALQPPKVGNIYKNWAIITQKSS